MQAPREGAGQRRMWPAWHAAALFLCLGFGLIVQARAAASGLAPWCAVSPLHQVTTACQTSTSCEVREVKYVAHPRDDHNARRHIRIRLGFDSAMAGGKPRRHALRCPALRVASVTLSVAVVVHTLVSVVRTRFSLGTLRQPPSPVHPAPPEHRPSNAVPARCAAAADTAVCSRCRRETRGGAMRTCAGCRGRPAPSPSPCRPSTCAAGRQLSRSCR